MSREAEAAVKPISLSFIRDVAADEDAFGSHDAVANTIANVIQSTDEVKVIGLLGPWGSGKSTVVRKTEAQLKAGPGKVTHMFCYDAWLYQSDPQRRSFLETFLRFLIEAGLTTEGRWRDQLNQLSRTVEETDTTTTPTLTVAGKATLLLAFAVALAMQFVGWDLVDAAFGPEASIAGKIAFYAGLGGVVLLPLAVLFGLLVYLRPVRNIFQTSFYQAENWKNNRDGHDGESVLGLLVNKSIERQRHRLTRDPEPTAIEFQKIFKAIMDEVAADNRRFLIVVDNLDRLHEAEAMSMWATIRSFFLGSNQHHGTLVKLPTVILPVDERAVEQMYMAEHGERAPLAAKAFMEKTFDLAFHVAPPVMTGWHLYLEKQMRAVFGEYLNDRWSYDVGRVLEAYWVDNGPVTPRGINTAVNAIGALWLQRGAEDIGFASIAFYAVFRDALSKRFMLSIQQPVVDISDLDPDWQRSIAALHFGVSPELALQVLIERDIRKAINEADQMAFDDLAMIKGFKHVFKLVLDQSQTSPARKFVNTAAKLLAGVDSGDAPWVVAAWQSIRKMLVASPNWDDLDDETLASVRLLLQRGGHIGQSAFIQGIASSLSQETFEAAKPSALFDRLTDIARVLCEAANAEGLPVPAIHIGGGAAGYLRAVTSTSTSPPTLRALRTHAKTQDLADELAKNLQSEGDAMDVEKRLIAIRALGLKLPWTKVLEAARHVVENHNASYPGMASALYCLNHFVHLEDEVAVRHAQELANGGVLTARLQEAVDGNMAAIAGRTTALILLNSASIDLGREWAHYVESMPSLPAAIEAELADPTEINHCDLYIDAVRRTPSFLPVAREIVSKRVRAGDLGLLYVGDVVKNIDKYLKCVEPELAGRFISSLSEYATFWEELDKRSLNDNTINLLRSLATGAGGDEDEQTKTLARDRLLKRLTDVSDQIWESAVRTGAEPLPVALALAELPNKATPMGNPLTEVLERMLPELVSAFEPQQATRWFLATSLLSQNARRTLLKNLRDRITGGSTIPQLTELLDLGGPALLKEGEFAKNADSSVRHIVLPLVAMSDQLDWLLANQKPQGAWVKGSSAETRGFLSEKLRDHWQSADKTVRGKLEQLAIYYGLSGMLSGDPGSNGHVAEKA